MTNNTKSWWVCIVFGLLFTILFSIEAGAPFAAAAFVLAGLDESDIKG